MDYQKAIGILQSLLDRYSLDYEEKEAVVTDIGVLGWASLSKSRARPRKAKRDESGQDEPAWVTPIFGGFGTWI